MKRFLSIFLIAAILVSMIPLNAFAAGETTQADTSTASDVDSESVWDGSIATGFATGDGSQDTPYIIETGAQLAFLAQSVNAGTNYSGKYISLANDIDLDDLPWTPIGGSDCPFYGTFCGNGFTISNLSLTTVYNDTGLFGVSYGTITDVSVKNAAAQYSFSIQHAIGTIVGTNSGTVAYCNADLTSQLTESVEVMLHVGGLVGVNRGLVSKSYADVSITVKGTDCLAYVGGAVGRARSSSEILDTHSSGSINVSGDVLAGGLVGDFSGSVIRNCYSTASVSASTSDAYNNAHGGGLIGYLPGSAVVENCYAKGTVYASAPKNSSAGGLVGFYVVNSSTGFVKNCYAGSSSVKSVLTKVNEGVNSYTGKLIGRISGTASVSNCYVNSAMSVSRMYFQSTDKGCDGIVNENITATTANCTVEGSNTFTYGSQSPRQLVGWGVYDLLNESSDPWVDNGNDPVLYTEKLVRGTIRYIRDGVVFNVYHENLYPGEGVDVTSPDIAKYETDLDTVTLSGNAATLIDVTYTLISHNLVVTCKDANGNILETYTERIGEDQNYSIPVKKITGYTPQQEYLSGYMGTEDQSAEVIYDVHTHTVTIRYLYLSDDSVAAQAYTAQVDYGQSLTVESPVLLGYKVATEGDESVHIDSMPDYDYVKTVYYIEAEAQAYTITTLLGDQGIPDVTVTFGDQTKLTDSNGVAVFNYPYGTTSVNLKIHKDGYTSGIYNETVEYQLKTSMGIDYFNMWVDTATNPNYSVQGISCFGTSIEKDFGVINTKYDGFIPIVLKGNVPDSDKITKILLVQEVETTNITDDDETVEAGNGNKVRKVLCTATPGDGVLTDDGVCTFQPKGTMFAYKAEVRFPVYAYMYTELGAEPIIQELKIDIIQFSANLKFDGLFDGAEFSLSDTGLSFLDGTKISFEMADKYKVGCPFSIEIKNNEVYIAYDLSDEFGEEIKAMDKKGYVKEMRDDESRIEKYMKSMNKAVDKKFKNNKWVHSNSTSSFDIDAEAAGGMAITVYGDGKIAMKSYLRMGLTMKASWTSDFVVVFLPITVTVSASVDGELTITGLGYDFEHQEIIWPSTEVSLGMTLGISAGIGNRFASVGAFGRFKIGATLVIGETTYFDALVLNGEGGFYAKLDLGLLTLYGEKSWTFLDKTIKLVPKGGIQVTDASTMSTTKGYLGEYDGLPVYDVTAYALENEETTVSPPEWTVKSSTLLVPNSLDTAAEQIISIGNYRVVVFFGNAPEREISNAKALYYRVHNISSGTWSNATLVHDDGTSDTAFDLIVHQGKLYLAYSQANTVFNAADYSDTTALINEMTYAQDISVAVFDADTATFQNVTQITTDSYYDSIPTFGVANDTLYLTWNKNTTHDNTTTFCMNTENYIWCTSFDGSAWAEPQCIMNRCYPVVDMAVTDLSGNMHVALIVDEDASLYTEDDRNIYFTDMDGNVTFLDCYGAGISSLQFVKHAGKSLLLWKKGTVIMATEGIDTTPYQFSAEGQVIGEDYSFINISDNLSALIWAEKDIEPETLDKTLTSDVYITYRHGDLAWTAPAVFTSVPYHLMSYSAVASGDFLYFAFTDTYIVIDDTSNEAASMYSKLCYRGVLLSDVLTLNSYEAVIDSEQGKVNITTTVTNNGPNTIEKISLTMKDYVKVPTENDNTFVPGGGTIILGMPSLSNEEKEYYELTTTKYELGDFTVNLLPGQSKEIIVQIELTDDMVLEDYVVTAKIVIDSSSSSGTTSGGTTIGGITITTPLVGTVNQGVSSEVLYPDLAVTGEYIIIGETEYLSIRVENIGKGTANGTLNIGRLGSDTTVDSVNIDGLMAKNVKYFLIRLEKDFFEQTNETFICQAICTNDQDASNNSVTVLARKLEGAAGTQKDTLVEAPILSDYQQTFDKYEPNSADIQVDITINDDTVRYVGCVDATLASVDHTVTEDEDGKTLHIVFSKDSLMSLELGTYEYTFLFLTELGYIDAVFTLDVADNTPIQVVGQISIIDGQSDALTPLDTAGRGMLLGLDLSSVNTDQLTFQWIVDGTIVSTERNLLIEQAYLGKRVQAKVIGVAPYYDELVSQSVHINRVPRQLDTPVILPESSDGTVLLQKVFHVGDDALYYGYSSTNDWTTVTNWQLSNQLELPESGTYYLFMMAPGSSIYEKAVSPSITYSYGITKYAITQKGRTLNYEDLIYVIDIFDLSGVEGIDLTKDAGLLIWSVEEFEALSEIAFDADHAKVGLKPYKTTGYYSGSSVGIFTRDLHEEAYYVGYVKLADGSYIYSEPKLYSPAIYATTMLGKANTSDATKELCVALLNYISAAQVYFHDTMEEELVNYELTDEQKALNWENISFNLAPEVPADKQVAMDETVFQRTGKNLLFEEMISIVSIFMVNDDIVANATESGTIYWTAEQFAALEGAPSIDNIGDGTKVALSQYRGNVNQWCSHAPEVAAKDMADTQYYYLGYVVHADGTVSYSGVISYTVEQYIYNTVNKTSTSAEMLAFAQRLYFYERAAEAALKN